MRIVILCGGSGSRLWPESRENLPKQFIPIFNGKSLLDLTIERILSINLNSKPIFISNKRHGFLVKKALLQYNLDANIILEPEGKNTCAAIYLAAKICSPNDNLLIMPSDHLIPNHKSFTKDILSIEKNLILDKWIVLGVKPTKPSEGFGYIKVEQSEQNKKNIFLKVNKFIEKPSKAVAEKFIQNEIYFWNAGIFITNAFMALKSIKEYAPNIAKYCEKAFNEIQINNETNEYNFHHELFSKIPSQSIDYAVMEHEKNIYLYPFKNIWSDVGSWDAIAEMRKPQLKKNNIIQIDSSDNFIKSDKRTIATIGIKDLIIIDSDDATLISKKNQTEKVKVIVKKLLKRKPLNAIEHSFENRPWGKFENLFDDIHCKVKRLIVNSQKRLSLQYHNFRSEHWLVVNGTATVYLDGKYITLTEGQSIDIPLQSRHYIENKEKKDLIIIETQLGSYFGEDDIIRLDDPYSR
ncbi:mannose-1-phosphate guanylyltransferase/mannose-6-phosphate isomerase [Alphaproteobacteria bacterium]|nr:mannose-1-phosphate guanylyltransferase/mannose-6-phosphate isomerase [Alphaproteobacteria bacterium]MDC1023113.1 mannose-1-phosphate guanylyltransferase/mannose-6-phosphate isomerase [Alphaproteobacteria bacterium]